MNENIGQTTGKNTPQGSYSAYTPATNALDYYGYLPAQADRPLREYTAIVFQHRWKILLCALLGVLLASWVNQRSPRIYSSKALVSVGMYIPPTPGTMSDVLRQQTERSSYTSSLVPILGSYTIANFVLANNEPIRAYVGNGSASAKGDYPLWMLESYLSMVSSSFIDGSNMLRITTYAKDAKIAAEIANSHADAFIQIVRLERKKAAAVNESFLRNKLESARGVLEVKQKALSEFIEKNNMHAINGELPPDVSAERFRGLILGIADAVQERASLQGELRETQASASARNPVLSDATQPAYLKLLQLKSDYALIKKQNSRHPGLPSIKGEIDAISKVIRQSSQRDIASRRVAIKAAEQRERLLTEELEKLKATEAKGASDRVTYMLMKQEKEAAEKAIEDAKQRLDDALVNIENDQSTVRKIDAAVKPEWPISPNTRSNLIAGTFAGTVFGIAIAFLLDFMNNAICSVTELQRATRCLIIGIVPIFSRRRRDRKKTGKDEEKPLVPPRTEATADNVDSALENARRAKESVDRLRAAATVKPGQMTEQERRLLKAGLSAADFAELAKAVNVHNIVCIKEPLSQEAESFRNIRTTLRHANKDGDAQIILVTSGRKGDGKTTVAANLAASMAQASARTLLIDADLRLPAVHNYFGLQREELGLVDYLTGDIERSDLIRQTEIPHLSVVVAGSATPIPAELLETQLMTELLESLKGEFDHIIIDSPPIAHVTDPLLLASQVSGVLLVARSGLTPTPVVEYAVQRLHQMNATIFGCVLNGVCRTNSYREAEYYFVAKKYQ